LLLNCLAEGVPGTFMALLRGVLGVIGTADESCLPM
jgi:hypothetical protein